MSSRSTGAKGRRRMVEVGTLHAIVEQARPALSAEQHGLLKDAVDTLASLSAELEQKGVSIRRLRKLLFGASTEKTSKVLGEQVPGGKDPPGEQGKQAGEARKKKSKGHGRNPARAYDGARQVVVKHDTLRHGRRCAACERGNVYALPEPRARVRVTGMAPLSATVYNLERFRCGACGEVFTAKEPEGIGPQKYDESVAGMIAMLKYGAGVPFYRLEKLQRSMGIPLPAATQWDLVRKAAASHEAVHDELIRQAAQGELLHNDDTTMKILELIAARPADPVSERKSDRRKGVYTTGILSKLGEQRIALFFTGLHHAGENLENVLKERASTLGPPIQMSDGLSHNTAGDFESIEANCNAHARRYFVDVTANFPEQCRFVLETLREVYRVDGRARREGMNDQQRLQLHRKENGPRMATLKKWLYHQIRDKKVEPNSGLGQAIAYMRKHWHKLVMFLRVAGAPLDNNAVERALKRAILHRKNALFYKTLNGAAVGDRFMSLIHSAALAGANPCHYLTDLQRHTNLVQERPDEWMPWNYRDTLSLIGAKSIPIAAAEN